MRKQISRNIAIVSAIFMVAFSLMLIVNYFQVKTASPLRSEVIETLKQLNDANANSPQLQENIRQLDLLARKAYFIRYDRLVAGAYLLMAMLAVFVVAVRVFLHEVKNIPDKQLEPADDWAVKTVARRYVGWLASFLVVAAVVFAFFSAPFLRDEKTEPKTQPMAENQASTPSDGAEAGYENAPVAAPVADENTADNEVEAAKQNENAAPIASAANPVVASDTAQPATAEKAPAAAPATTSNSFRGNSANATSSAKNVPYSWNLKSRENVAWHSPVPRKGYSSPVLNGGKIFVTGADNQARDLYCFDLATGNLLWTLAATGIAGSPSAMPETTDDTGLAAPTPATNGKQVCAIFATGDLICADMDGQRLWAKNLGVPQNHYGYASSLLAYGSTLFVQYANSVSPRILALDMATGAEKWVKTLADKIAWSSPSLAYTDGKPMLVVAGNPAITAYNLSNGEQLWRVEGLSGEVASSPCSAGGLVFGAAEYAAVIAVNATTGEKLWSVNDYMPETSSPAATADHVYVATSYGVLASYDTKTGALQQQLELGGEFYSSPMLVEGKLFLFSNGGTFHAYALGSELKPLASFDTGERTFATPAFTDGYMVVRTEGNLYCVTKN